ncbi:MAG: antitoxin VapB family protein, partial [Candidatus Heimdallarchaeota archaeon]
QNLNICVHVCLYVATKTITIKEEVYRTLIALKKENESFSDLLARLATRSNTLELLRNMSGSIKFGDTKKVISEIYERRKDWN